MFKQGEYEECIMAMERIIIIKKQSFGEESEEVNKKKEINNTQNHWDLKKYIFVSCLVDKRSE